MSPPAVSQLLHAVFALFLHQLVLFLLMFLENFFEVELLQKELSERGLADARFSADHDGESGGRTRICQLLQITPCEGLQKVVPPVAYGLTLSVDQLRRRAEELATLYKLDRIRLSMPLLLRLLFHSRFRIVSTFGLQLFLDLRMSILNLACALCWALLLSLRSCARWLRYLDVHLREPWMRLHLI